MSVRKLESGFIAIIVSAGLFTPIACKSRTLNEGIVATQDNSSRDPWDDRFGSVLSNAKTAAFCVTSGNPEKAMSALRINADQVSNSVEFIGPSNHHEPHVKGVLVSVKAGPQEGTTIAQLKNGILQQVAGEDENQPTVVSNITFISTLDDMAQKDFRNQVELVTSKGKQTFKNCRFGKGLAAIGNLISSQVSIDPWNDRFGSVLSNASTAAFCVTSGNPETAMSALRINAEKVSGAVEFKGPSNHHEPHVKGVMVSVKAGPQEGTTIAQLKNGILQQVSGEGEDQPTVVSSITFISTLDDMAQKDFRNQVELVTSKGKETFKNCRFGKSIGKIR